MKKAAHIDGLLKHATSRTELVAAKVAEAMRSIETEIECNDGLYPLNGGRLSRQEVCRRAGIRSSVLDGPCHRSTTLPKLRSWLEAVHKKMILGKRSVRKAVTERADGWKARAEAFAHQTNLYHLKMVTIEHQLLDANSRVRELEETVSALQSELSRGKVTSVRKR